MEESGRTEKETPRVESMKQGAAGDKPETSEPSKPAKSSYSKPQISKPSTSNLLGSAQSTSASNLSSKSNPQLIQAGPRLNKINPMVTPGLQGPKNNQHPVHWNDAELRAKKKFYKWSFLAILVISLSVALFFYFFYMK